MTPLLQSLSQQSLQTTVELNALSIDAFINGFKNLEVDSFGKCVPFSSTWSSVKNRYEVIAQDIPAIKTIRLDSDGVVYEKHQDQGKFKINIYDHKHKSGIQLISKRIWFTGANGKFSDVVLGKFLTNYYTPTLD